VDLMPFLILFRPRMLAGSRVLALPTVTLQSEGLDRIMALRFRLIIEGLFF
jgi:hypothetical protein